MFLFKDPKDCEFMTHTMTRSRLKNFVCLFIVVLTISTYWQLPSHNFLNLDDNKYITQNSHIQQGITPENFYWAFNFVDIAYWHPITWIFHMLFFQFFGMNPSMHHLMNLFLHIANSLLLFFVFNRMTGSLWKSAFIAALFALHPLNVESVAWASELKNVLSTLFWMLTILFYARYAERPNFYRYLIIIFVFTMGLMAKPMLVTLPFVLLLLDYWPLNRLKITQSSGMLDNFSQSAASVPKSSRVLGLILEKIPFIFLSVFCIYLSSLSVKRPGVIISTAMVPMKLRIANALISYVTYLKKMVWPYHLGVFYPYPKVIPIWEVGGAALFLVCLTFWAFLWIKKKPYLAVGWLWYIGTLVPVIGLVQVGLWPAIADRFAYVPLIGLLTSIVWGISDLIGRWRCKKMISASICIVIILAFAITTYSQNRYWTNNITLFKHTLDVTKDNAIAHQKLGEALSVQGKTDEAAMQFYEALRITPSLIGANLNLGVILREQGKFDKAIEYFSKVTQLSPGSADGYYEIAVTMEKKGNFDAAIRYYSKALQIKPDAARIHNNLGVVLARQNNEKEAIFQLHEALGDYPNYTLAHYNLGKIYINQRNIEKAILEFKKSLHLNPNMPEALYNLSWILATHEEEKYRNGEKAIKFAKNLCKITMYTQPLAFDALAAAYAETGNFDDAVQTAQKGLQLALLKGPDELVSGLKERLQLYKARKPYRQHPKRKNAS